MGGELSRLSLIFCEAWFMQVSRKRAECIQTKANAKAPFMNCNGCFMVEPKLFSKEVDILLQAIP